MGGLLSYVLVVWFVDERPSGRYGAGRDPLSALCRAQRNGGVRRDRTGSSGLGLEPVQWAIDGFGWLGGGLGVASQGAQHFGGGAEVFGGAGEGGLGKITAELGVPGLVIALWFGFAAVRYGWHVLMFVSQRSATVARLAYGLVAFLVANLAVFFVATQVFGDLFVLLAAGAGGGILPGDAGAGRARAGPAQRAGAPCIATADGRARRRYGRAGPDDLDQGASARPRRARPRGPVRHASDPVSGAVVPGTGGTARTGAEGVFRT